MAYGTVKVDNITFTNGGSDQTITVSGIVQSISGNITATGTLQGTTIIGTSTVSGATITGNAGNFTTITGGTVTLTSGVIASGDGKLLVGTSSATGAAILQAQTPTTLSTTADSGVRFANTATKTYSTTANFSVTTGLGQNIELGNAAVVDPTTPGGLNYVYGISNNLTKSAGNVQDIERLYFGGFDQRFTWADANTCKQYIGINDIFTYSGIDANGRTSSILTAQAMTLSPPDGGTQTVANVTGSNIILYAPGGTATINVTNSKNLLSQLRFTNNTAGTKTVNITNHAFFGTNSSWGTAGSTGTLNATITNLYGLQLTAPSASTGLTITNNWGISQEWSSAKNWFAAASNQFPNITTTASGANAFLDSADSNRLYRSTSSIVYKKDVEDLDHALADSIHQFRPVWYRSKCELDRQDWSWFGLIAEEVAAIEPRLVHYGYQEDAYELIDITDTVELPPDDPRRESGQETEEVTKQERRLKSDAQKVPNGVAYDRLTVLLLDVVQRQEDRIKNLEARLIALESA
jgi:hypothetical protein